MQNGNTARAKTKDYKFYLDLNKNRDTHTPGGDDVSNEKVNITSSVTDRSWKEDICK